MYKEFGASCFTHFQNSVMEKKWLEKSRSEYKNNDPAACKLHWLEKKNSLPIFLIFRADVH